MGRGPQRKASSGRRSCWGPEDPWSSPREGPWGRPPSAGAQAAAGSLNRWSGARPAPDLRPALTVATAPPPPLPPRPSWPLRLRARRGTGRAPPPGPAPASHTGVFRFVNSSSFILSPCSRARVEAATRTHFTGGDNEALAAKWTALADAWPRGDAASQAASRQHLFTLQLDPTVSTLFF